jgi:dynein light chain roadblock-type
MKAKSIIRDLDPTNDLTFLRIKSKNNEIMVAPGQFKKLKNYHIYQ